VYVWDAADSIERIRIAILSIDHSLFTLALF